MIFECVDYHIIWQRLVRLSLREFEWMYDAINVVEALVALKRNTQIVQVCHLMHYLIARVRTARGERLEKTDCVNNGVPSQ